MVLFRNMDATWNRVRLCLHWEVYTSGICTEVSVLGNLSWMSTVRVTHCLCILSVTGVTVAVQSGGDTTGIRNIDRKKL